MKIVGRILRENREKKGIAIEDLSKKLAISVYYLSAIESGQYNKTPGNPYTLGFIKTYAKHLELDVDFIEKIFRDETVSNKKISNIYLADSTTYNHLNYLKYGTGIFIFLFCGMFFYNFFLSETYLANDYASVDPIDDNLIAIVEEEELKNGIQELKKKQLLADLIQKNYENDKYIASIQDSKITDDEDNVLVNNNINAIAAMNTDKKNSKKSLIFRFTNETWVQIKDSSEKVIISKLMKKNEEFIFHGNEDYLITTGNAGNILLIMDNKDLGKIGKKGQVINSVYLSEITSKY